MKLLISDYAILLGDTAEKEKQYLLEKSPEWEVEIYAYNGNILELEEKMNEADALLTSFLPLDDKLLDKMDRMKCISFNATGYNTVDLNAATKKGIGVLAINEYCTLEVAEHTMSLILALNRQIKYYIKDVEENYNWSYESAGEIRRLCGQKIGIFGFGRIGQRVAKLARSFGMEIYVYQDVAHPIAKQPDIHLADVDEICAKCSIITNHMSQTRENQYFFNKDVFSKMKQNPIFVNVGRGEAVDEEALIWALDEKILYGAALDVLESENPQLQNNRLLKRDNVVLTPHTAFYSQESFQSLCQISINNMLNYMNKNYEKLEKLVNPEVLKQIGEGEKG